MSLSWNIPGPSTPCSLEGLPKRQLRKTVLEAGEYDNSDYFEPWSEEPATEEDLEAMSSEADVTRWWVSDQKLWQNTQQTIRVPVDRESDDVHTLYPLTGETGDVGRPASKRKARYYLKFDATIWAKTSQGYALFDPEGCKHPRVEVKEVTRRLRQVRGQ